VRKIVATPRSVLMGIGLMLLALLVFSAPALAAKERLYTGVSFGPSGTGAGTFANVQGVTVDQKTGDVFVYDDGEGGRIYKFSASGEPVNFSGLGTNVITGVGGSGSAEEEIAVDSSSGPDAGDIYAANNNVVQIYSAAGSPLGTLSGGEMCGVAVDASGAVYVGIYSQGAVRKYVPTVNPVTNGSEVASMRGLGGICNVAADSEGNLYAANWSGGVTRYEAFQFGAPVANGTPIDGAGRTLTVDQSTGALYVNERNAIAEYDASGNSLGRSRVERINESFGVGVDNATERLYTPSDGRVIIFGSPLPLPTVIGGKASEITSSSVTLEGNVDPEGTPTTYQFQYGQSGSYGLLTPATPQGVGSDWANHEVESSLTGLAPSTEYHYRLLAIGANGTSYGSDRTFTTNGPPSIDSESASQEAQTSVTVAAYIKPYGLDTHYQVEYGATESYGSSTASVDKGDQAGEVTIELNGLSLSTTYHYRFVASNSEGTTYGPDQTVSTTPAARVENESGSDATDTEATLRASVDDFGQASTYDYEYGTNTSYGSVTPTRSLAGVTGPAPAMAEISALHPETTYHFRIVTSNEFGTVAGTDVSFSTAPSSFSGLPDGRGYEKVSPNENGNGNTYQPLPIVLSTSEGGYTELPFEAAPDGNAVTYVGDPPESGGIGNEGGDAGNQYLARRVTGGGWAVTDIDPPSSNTTNRPHYEAFSPNLSSGFLVTNDPPPNGVNGPAGFNTIYRQDLGTGAYEPLFTVTPPHRAPEEFFAAEILSNSPVAAAAYAGSSTDLKASIFMVNDTLTSSAVDGGPGENNLYETRDGALELVNVLPDGSTEPNAVFGGIPNPESAFDAPSLEHVISEDGKRVFWTDLSTGDLYLREDGTRTVQVDASVGGGGRFWTATPGGSEALFLKGGDLYKYEVDNAQTTDLIPGGGVQGIVATTADLSYVYFVAQAALAPGAEYQACEALCNLYVLHSGEPIKFISRLSANDNEGAQTSYAKTGDWRPDMGAREAEVTPDGRDLAFVSTLPLTGYDNKGHEEVYEYEFYGNKLYCASCVPSGEEESQTYAYAFPPVSHTNTYVTRWVSDDGNEVFFDTNMALVPQDTDAAVDVYEWEHDGSGSCTRSQGCVYLLSGGSSSEGSFLIETSASGEDVFFTTRTQLVPEDRNENIDVYDATTKVAHPSTPPQCTGTGCQGSPSAPPVFATPSSVTYNGVGNFPAGAVKQPTKQAKNLKAKKKAKKGNRSKKKSKRSKRKKGGANGAARTHAKSQGRSS
jgi:hypothetical protein